MTVDQNPTAPRPASATSGTAGPAVLPRFAAVRAGRARRRYAVVGTGHHAGLYVAAVTGAHADVAELVAWCDTNPTRMACCDTEAGRALGLDGPAGLVVRAQAAGAVILDGLCLGEDLS